MKRVLTTLLKAAISLGLIAFFLNRVEWREVEAAAVGARPGVLLLAVLLFAASNLLGAFQWGVLLRAQGIRLPLRTVVTLYFVGVFFNNFMVGNIGGDAVRIYDLRRLTGEGVSGFAATFLDRFIGLFTLSCFSAVAYALSPHLWGLALGTPILVLGGGLLGVLCFGFSRRLSSLVLRVARRVFPARVADLLKRVRQAFILYRHAYGMLARVGFLAVGVQLCRVGVYDAVGHALGQTVAFRNFVVFIPLIAIVAAVPVSFGGIGVRENLGALLFGRVGVAPASALTMMFLGYLAGILASLVGGIVFIARRGGGLGEGRTSSVGRTADGTYERV